MVVLQLGPYPPPHGGVQTNLVAIRDYLRSRGMAAPVINLTRHRRRDSDDVYYPQSGGKYGGCSARYLPISFTSTSAAC